MEHSSFKTSFDSYIANRLSTTELDAHLREEGIQLQTREGTCTTITRGVFGTSGAWSQIFPCVVQCTLVIPHVQRCTIIYVKKNTG